MGMGIGDVGTGAGKATVASTVPDAPKSCTVARTTKGPVPEDALCEVM